MIQDFIEEQIIVSNKAGEGKKIVIIKHGFMIKEVRQAELSTKEFNEIVTFLRNYFK